MQNVVSAKFDPGHIRPRLIWEKNQIRCNPVCEDQFKPLLANTLSGLSLSAILKNIKQIQNAEFFVDMAKLLHDSTLQLPRRFADKPGR